ncbi:MAG: hypothetical protein IKE55_10350 [Kiritimatiellae bacterium]|nr:hypothetical protein [Kiritimatiellia bacterium]
MKRLIMVGAAAAMSACAGAEAAWTPGEPVVSYWGGPGWMSGNPQCPPLNETWVKQLKDGGFNVAWAATPEDLDLLAKHGMRAIYKPNFMNYGLEFADPAKEKAAIEELRRTKDHPALYVYQLRDEPSAKRFPSVAREVEWLRRVDPKHPAWINLLPTYANNEQLGVDGDIIRAYWEHVRLFGEIVRPDLVTYDHYQFKRTGDGRNYFLNLGIIRQIASARRVPFWNGVQSCSWVPGKLASPRSPRIPGPDEMRFLVYTTAAYGAQGIYYYVYSRRGHDGAIVEMDGTPSDKYEVLKTLNREFVSIARILSRLKFSGAYFQGRHPPGTTPYCEQALLEIAPETPFAELEDLQDLADTSLVTRFDAPDRPPCLMVVNCDYRKDRTIHVKAPMPALRFDALARTWSPVGQEFDLALTRGSGVLLRLEPKK